MTSMLKCPDCGGALVEYGHRPRGQDGFAKWKACPICLWNEREELAKKIREELANGDGVEP